MPLGLKQLADVQSLSAPEVAVDAPVEGELEGSPVEASAAWSVSARVLAGGGAGRGAYRTCVLELMATMARERCVDSRGGWARGSWFVAAMARCRRADAEWAC